MAWMRPPTNISKNRRDKFQFMKPPSLRDCSKPLLDIPRQPIPNAQEHALKLCSTKCRKPPTFAPPMNIYDKALPPNRLKHQRQEKDISFLRTGFMTLSPTM